MWPGHAYGSVKSPIFITLEEGYRAKRIAHFCAERITTHGSLVYASVFYAIKPGFHGGKFKLGVIFSNVEFTLLALCKGNGE